MDRLEEREGLRARRVLFAFAVVLATVAVAGSVLLLVWALPSLLRRLIALVVTLGAGVGFGYTARNYCLSRQGYVTDRYAKAVDQLVDATEALADATEAYNSQLVDFLARNGRLRIHGNEAVQVAEPGPLVAGSMDDSLPTIPPTILVTDSRTSTADTSTTAATVEATTPVVPVWEPLVIDRGIFPLGEPLATLARPYRPDTVIDGFSTESLVIRAASLRGYVHRFKGVPRQDELGLGVHENGTIVVAVADGISSATYSHLGSSIACRQAIDWCLNALDNQVPSAEWDWQNLLQSAAWALVDYAKRQFGPSEDGTALATTLIVSVIEPASTGFRLSLIHISEPTRPY